LLPDNIVAALKPMRSSRISNAMPSAYHFNFSPDDTQIYTAGLWHRQYYGLADGSGVVFSEFPTPMIGRARSSTARSAFRTSLVAIIKPEYSKVELYQLDFSTGKARRVGSDMNTFVLNSVNPSGLNMGMFTPLPTPVPPSATPPTFGLNTQVIVNPGIQALNVRETPDANAFVVEILPGGALMTITDGPVEAGGYTWWRVLLPSANVGWVAERVGDAQMIQLP
jgi:hypothetical protein